MAHKMDVLFRYWAFTHNPKIGTLHARSFAGVFGLSPEGMESCWRVLTAREVNVGTIQGQREFDMRGPNERLTSEAYNALTLHLPYPIAENLLILLCMKYSVHFKAPDLDEDYRYTIGSFGGVYLFHPSVWPHERLAKHKNPVYNTGAYERFPRA